MDVVLVRGRDALSISIEVLSLMGALARVGLLYRPVSATTKSKLHRPMVDDYP